WGVKVPSVEVKHVDISEELRRAMARQAEAERERRAKIIASEGEYQAAEKICQAAEMMQKYPMALQLRYLQTLVEIGGENNTTTIFPIPIDIFEALKGKNFNPSTQVKG
ncbi:MAG: slipin family protein, partial [Candidatus Omnitrophica bacterium]|nr:slipin family protein [Candidatus Omnitrophota bacterium]